jgi:hypothetical protein
MGRADLTNEQWVRLVPLLPTGKKLHASFAKLSLGPCRGRGGMSLLPARLAGTESPLLPLSIRVRFSPMLDRNIL